MEDFDQIEQRRHSALIGGLALGALLGFAYGRLVAPRSGARTRELVVEQGLLLKDRVSDQVARLRHRNTSPL